MSEARLTENQRIVFSQVSEKQLQESVRQCAIRNGWKFFHPLWMQRSDPGWPDCVMIRGARLVVAELKTMTGKVTPAQQEWLDAWRATGAAEVYVLRPCDLDAIQKTLL